MDLSKLQEFDINDIDVNDIKKIGSAPTPVKAFLIILLCLIAGGAGVFLDTKKQLEALETFEKEEQTLRVTFDQKQSKAANLEAYAQQLEDMKQSFGALLRQLPNKTEIESLLTDISQTGIASGLEIEFFKPEGLSPKEFYAEFPIKLRVTGRYHQFGKFVSGVAALPRIVTMRDISISKPKDTSGVQLQMEVTAVTYQYLDEQEDV
ncbi:MAG: pilus assembly protein PilO [endosymbiont of Galathealinum brachiosum]|uniref:Pilus assembly protein PilO n=1 Tax=endosymbiont of Galathealinum brachiosum TaxID=2200906 RepID=A0A370D9R6_9GAMM|nr:MAG: pilus assembly protein PilO [endosymbiont of Galathealinum brachiosum]